MSRACLLFDRRARRCSVLGQDFLGPLIAEVMRIMDGYNEPERAAIMRFLGEIAALVPAGSREETLAIRGARAIAEPPADAPPRGAA